MSLQPKIHYVISESRSPRVWYLQILNLFPALSSQLSSAQLSALSSQHSSAEKFLFTFSMSINVTSASPSSSWVLLLSSGEDPEKLDEDFLANLLLLVLPEVERKVHEHK